MEIELVTTKTKLTLSLVKQMPPLKKDSDSMSRCEVLGYFRHPGITKGMNTAIVLLDDEYRTITLYPWCEGQNSGIYARIKHASVQRFFKNDQERATWLELYGLIKAKALATHIYL